MPRPRHFVLPLILLVALAFRVYRLVAFPPGFHFDEAIDLKIALDVLGGARPIYVAEGWGREALYYYLVAPMLRLIDYNPLALRATAVLCGMGVLVAAYGLARRLRGQTAAWLTVAWLAVAMWPVWAARFGVRHISLALLLGLAAWAFWWSFGRIRNYELGIRNIEFLIAGALLGLTAYTYQPARFVPLLFGGFALYLLLFHRRPTADTAMWHNRRGWAVWGLTAAVVALPLIVVLTQVTPIETGERAFSIEPLTELLAGNPRPVLANAVAVAGVFTVRGDPLKSYNLPDRPLFVPRLTGVFFYVGLALAVWRWRRPANAFVLLWLVAGLLPTIVTISAPNFNRMVAAQFPIFFLAALGATEVIDWAAARRRWAGAGAAALVVVALGLTAAVTARDLFRVWPEQFADAHPLNREIAAVADFLEHRADGRPVVISSRDIEDEDPYVVSVSLDRAIDRRWVDSSQALALPAGAAEAWLIVTADRWIDPLLADVVNLGEGSPPLGAAQPAAPAPGGLKPAAIQPTPVQPDAPAPPGGLKPAAISPNRLNPVTDDAANPLQRVSFASRGFQPAAFQPAPVQPAPFQPPPVQSAPIQPAAPPPPGGLKPAAISPNRLKPVADDAANPLQRVSFASRGFQPAAFQPAPVQPTPVQPAPVQSAPIQPDAPAPPGGLKPAAINPNRLKPVADDAANPLQRVSFASRGFQPAAVQPAPFQPPPVQSAPIQPAAPPPPGGLKPTAINPNRLKPVAADAANPLQRVSFASRGFQPAAILPAAFQPPPINQNDYANDMFSLHRLTAANWPTLPTPHVSLPPESSYAPSYPVPFCACEPGAAAEPALWLTGVEPGAARPGEELTLLTSWQTGPARFLSLAMFVHLLDAAGNIVAQDDGLGYPPHTWQPGDRFIQLARLPLPPDLPPGDYTLQFGLYDRATGARWPVLNAEGQPAGDRLLLYLP